MAIKTFITLFFIIFAYQNLYAETRLCDPLTGSSPSDIWNTVNKAIQFPNSCANPKNADTKAKIMSWTQSLSTSAAAKNSYLAALQKFNLDCFTGNSNPAIACLAIQGIKVYSCGSNDFCFDANGLVYQLAGDTLNKTDGFTQWEVFPKTSKGRGAVSLGESVGRVNLNYSNGSQRVWLNKSTNSLLMDKFDLSKARTNVSKSQLCQGAFANPNQAINLMGNRVREIADYQNSFWKNYKGDWDASLNFLKGESVGFKKVTWDILAALSEEETWSAMGKQIAGADAGCFNEYKGNRIQWIGCMTIKFGKTMIDGIANAAKECRESFAGSSAEPEKAGECIGKAIGVALSTGIGTKGLASAVDATKGAKTLVGKAAGNAAQVVAKCIGEVCGLNAGKTELGFGAAKVTNAGKAVAEAAAAQSTAQGASHSAASQNPNVDGIENPKKNNVVSLAERRKNPDKSELEVANLADKARVTDSSFIDRMAEDAKSMSSTERKTFTRTMVQTFKELNPAPVQNIKESRLDFEGRLKDYQNRINKVAHVALGFAENGVTDTHLVNRLLNGKAWSTEALAGVDSVLKKARSEYKGKVAKGKTPEQARAEATRSAIAQLSEGKRWEDLNPKSKENVNRSCRCIGMCPVSAAASNDMSPVPNFDLRDNAAIKYSVCVNNISN